MVASRTHSLIAMGLCVGLWVVDGTASAAVPAGPARAAAQTRTVLYDVELAVTPQTRYVGSKVTVDAHKTFFRAPNRLTRWKVSFGDGHSRSGTSVTIPKLFHTYAKTGPYPATLAATDAHGVKQTVKFGFHVVKRPVNIARTHSARSRTII
jgi:PKD repeat protein